MRPAALTLALALAPALAFTTASPAHACLTCGCSGSGISGDVAGGGSAFLFSNCANLIIQQGLSARTITGSFTETGAWNPTPTDGALNTLQGSFGVMWFPTPSASLSLSLPVVGNSLQRATWGPLGSLAPTDVGAVGGGVGDVGFQGSLKLLEGEEGSGIAGWVGGSVPSGRAIGDPAALTGAGVVNAQAGVLATHRIGAWTFTGNVGVQRPLTSPPLTGTTFYIGNAFLWQAQVAHIFNPGLEGVWSLGLGLQGFRGEGRFGPNDVPFAMGKLRVVPAFQYDFDLFRGFRLSAGVDPALGGTNAMTDATFLATFYQGFML